MLTLSAICAAIQAGCTPEELARMRREVFNERNNEMPFDSELNRLESNLTDLEREVETLNMCISHFEYNKEEVIISLNRTLARLTGLKELAEMKIKVHKERVKESGVKY